VSYIYCPQAQYVYTIPITVLDGRHNFVPHIHHRNSYPWAPPIWLSPCEPDNPFSGPQFKGLTNNAQAELNAPEKAMRCLHQPEDTFALPSPRTCIPMDPPSFAIVTSIFTLGGLIGALSSGPLSTAYGRLLPLRLASVFFVLGPLFSALAPNFGLLVTGRFLSGIGSGAALVIVPIYIGEIAPMASKGSFGALTQITINVGILLAQVLGYFLSYGVMWRVVLAVVGGLAVVQAVGLFGVVESPKWLASKNKVALGKSVLQKIRGDTDIEGEVAHWGNGGDTEGKNLISISKPARATIRNVFEGKLTCV